MREPDPAATDRQRQLARRVELAWQMLARLRRPAGADRRYRRPSPANATRTWPASMPAADSTSVTQKYATAAGAAAAAPSSAPMNDTHEVLRGHAGRRGPP